MQRIVDGVVVNMTPQEIEDFHRSQVDSFTPITSVKKSTVMARISAAGKIGVAFQALQSSPDKFARWFAPDKPVVNTNDPDAIAFITELGLDPNVILALGE
jgi:hypothetical protein